MNNSSLNSALLGRAERVRGKTEKEPGLKIRVTGLRPEEQKQNKTLGSFCSYLEDFKEISNDICRLDIFPTTY